ncbi:DUF2828 domail-containing protein [Bacillus phage vB_BanS_Skywalker]|uniref:DUF2828 domail-containing protein n=2 Tax=Tsamsavirus TaxID=3044849 RepID=A0AAE8YYI6_9CAUD|nr:DUF2828 domail-containing protein [Bacillus phage vB_BanS_Skywalker]YP_010681115.1 DUF2828 family protein [Bacillus phage vB_BanS_MrDarsey]UGO48051.1 DUF2828 family protein [Bacillus phage vB_BanS_MrDarsey]UGO51207.1 DUF2828 domail-containing protein [Bacillus phage vB_BanS_Skywalker]
MLNHLKNEFNKTTTENGALAYKSTKSDVLDLFSQGGAMRQRSEADVKALVSKAFGENQLLTLRTIFYLRDIEQGQGERRFFRLAMQHLAVHHKEALRKNIELVPMFGRWDDLWVLLETDLKADVLDFVKRQLVVDKEAEHPSLLAKWMPSENASSYKTKKYAKIMREHFGVKPKQYRKLLSALRAKLNLVETKLSEKRYGDIQYDKLPSRAGMVYRGAFFRNDEERYKGFLDSLSKGEVTVNAKTLYPNDIVGKILHRYVSPEDIKLFEGQWENLPNFIGEKTDNALVMADVSESMSGTPMEVSIALAMYIAERNKGIYHNHFLTFTDRPSFVEIKGTDIVEKVRNINARKGYSTNIKLALQKVLDVAVENKVPNSETVKKLYIISDMQFDDWSIDGTSVDIFKEMRKRFEEKGYDFPEIVFWNVRAVGNTPMTMNDQGVQLVSGYSPSILKNLLDANGKTPYEFMLEVLETERYEKVTV